MKYLNLNGYEECPNSRERNTEIKTIAAVVSSKNTAIWEEKIVFLQLDIEKKS